MVRVSIAGSRGNDQAAGEHLPLREHCSGQRIEDALAAHGPGYLGSHRRGVPPNPLAFSLSTPVRGWAGTASRSILFIFHGRPRSGISAPASSSWPARSTSACLTRCSNYVAKALNQHKKALNGAKVLVLGVAYKKDIDDLRESPSLTIIELLQAQGAEVSYNDPFFPPSEKAASTTCR